MVQNTVYKLQAFTQCLNTSTYFSRLSPIPSTPVEKLRTVCTRLFHITFVKNTSVILHLSALSTPPTITTTIYIFNK